MNTNTQSLGRRMTAVTLLAGAIAAGGVGAAATAGARPPVDPAPAPAQPRPAPAAAGRVASIAFSPETGAWASWTNAPTLDKADSAALNLCLDRASMLCVVTGHVGITTNDNECVALAVDAVDWTQWRSGIGTTVINAETAALQGPNSRIATVACTTQNASPTGASGHVDRPQWS